MKYIIILSLFSFSAFALDSFSVIRYLGTNGKGGTQNLQLLCAQNSCQITSGINDQVSERKNIPKIQAEEFFKSAKLALAQRVKVKDSKQAFILETGSTKVEGQSSTPELLRIEYKLQQMLLP